jgi:serine protease Do
VVTLYDGRTLEATLRGTDPLTDLAVIKIEGRNFPTAPFGDTTRLRPGNIVVAIGNPLGLEGGPTITFGIVSNTERSFTLGEVTFYDVIQTDAAINPGNSGGPLVDLHGEVVGINTVLIGRAQGIGFAIGAGTAQPVSQALIAPPHRVIRPWLGVLLSTVTPAVATEYGLARTRGVLVGRLVESSPADKAGLREGDVITHFEGEEVVEATQMIKALWRHRVGDRVEITFWRGQEEKKAIIELSVERP